MEESSEKYLLEHKDEYETLEYSNVENLEERYHTVFNKRFSYMDVEANAKEGWINVIVSNEVSTILTKNIPFPTPYLIYKDNIPQIAKVKLYGDVVIFKIDKFGNFIKKLK